LLKHLFGVESFSACALSIPWAAEVEEPLVYYPHLKICTAKAISRAILEVYPVDLSITCACIAGNWRGRGKKEQKITP
jgi:hypothetical protein